MSISCHWDACFISCPGRTNRAGERWTRLVLRPPPSYLLTWNSVQVTLSSHLTERIPGRKRARYPGNSQHGLPLEGQRRCTFTVIATGLNQPTSMEFIGNTAYIITLGGQIWKIDNVSK
jgi:hypothetical protein